MKKLRRRALLLLLACLLAALAGQYYFLQVRDRFWDGVVFYAIAVLCLVWLLALHPAARQEEGATLWRRLWATVRAHPARVWTLAIALFSVYTAIRLNDGGKHGQALFFWAVGVVAVVGTWAGLREESPAADAAAPPDDSAGATRGLPLRDWEILALVGCTVLALVLRLARLGTVPYVLNGDEGSMGLEAVGVLQGRITDPFATGWLSHPTLYFFMLAGPIKLLGQNAWGVRLLSPFAGAAAIPVLYFLARRLFDRQVALAATVLLTFSHLHIHFSRLALNNVYDPLFGLLAFFFLVRGLQENRLVDFALSGLFLSLAQFFYMGARLLPLIAAVFLLLWWVLQPARRKMLLPAAALGSTFLLSGAPLFRFFIVHWEDFTARLKAVGIIQSGWLQTEPQVTGKSAIVLLWEQLRKSLLAFNYTLDPTSHYGAKIPYLDFVSGILFVLGLVVIVRRWRQTGPLLAGTWFGMCLIFGGMLIENPPSSPRFVIFLPAVCLIAAAGLAALLDLVHKWVKLPCPWLNRAFLAVLVVAALLNVGYYFLDYTPAGRFGGLNTEVGTRVGEYLHRQEPGSQVYFFGPPRMWVGYSTIPFLAPGHVLSNVEQPLAGPPAPPLGPQDTFFIFLPERAGELQWVEQSYPEGVRSDFYGHEGTVLFVAYRVTRGK